MTCPAQGHSHSAAEVVRDPVCAMTVDPAAGKPTHEHGGHLYHFCATGCRDKFAAAPDDFISAEDPVCGMSVDRATARHFRRVHKDLMTIEYWERIQADLLAGRVPAISVYPEERRLVREIERLGTYY